jgi:hypothetical protein
MGLNALRSRPGIYLGPSTPGSRIRKLIEQALSSVIVDAGFSAQAVIRFESANDHLSVSHNVFNTPLTSPQVSLDDLNLVSSQMGYQAMRSGLSPYGQWSGIPVVNAFSDEMEISATIAEKRYVLAYREGDLISSRVDQVSPPGGLSIKFRPSPDLVGSASEVEEAAAFFLGNLDALSRAIGDSIKSDSHRFARQGCSFCGGEASDDRRLISGPGVFICHACVRRCRSELLKYKGHGGQIAVWWSAGGDGSIASSSDGDTSIRCAFCQREQTGHAVVVTTRGVGICADCVEVAENS